MDDDDIMVEDVHDGIVLLPIAAVEADALLAGPLPADDNNNNNGGTDDAVAPNSPLVPPPQPFMTAPNPLGFLTRTWTTMHCGELIQDPLCPSVASSTGWPPSASAPSAPLARWNWPGKAGTVRALTMSSAVPFAGDKWDRATRWESPAWKS